MFKNNSFKDFIYVTQQRDFDTVVLSPPFGIGHTCASFQMSGTIPKIRD